MTQWGEKSGVALASWNVPFYHVKLKINISSTKVNVVTPIKNVKKIKKKKPITNLELNSNLKAITLGTSIRIKKSYYCSLYTLLYCLELL